MNHLGHGTLLEPCVVPGWATFDQAGLRWAVLDPVALGSAMCWTVVGPGWAALSHVLCHVGSEFDQVGPEWAESDHVLLARSGHVEPGPSKLAAGSRRTGLGWLGRVRPGCAQVGLG